MITRTTCRVCDGSLEPVLDLGEHYVSDFISPGDSDGTKAPLELVICRRCRLLQLKHTVPGETMYRNYWYRSGTNQTMRDALADIANKAETLIHLQDGRFRRGHRLQRRDAPDLVQDRMRSGRSASTRRRTWPFSRGRSPTNWWSDISRPKRSGPTRIFSGAARRS